MLRALPAPAVLALTALALVGWAQGPTLSADATSEQAGHLVSFDGNRLVVEVAGKDVSYPVPALASLRRFGEPGAAASEFQPGERLRITLQGGTVTQISDEISPQVAQRQPLRVVSQDRERYRFTVEPVDGTTGAAQGERLTLAYGKPTFLVQRENPEFVFRVAEGARLWINRGTTPDRPEEVAREVLDDASRERFARQQRLRTVARLDVTGAPAQVQSAGTSAVLQLSLDAEVWAQRLHAGDQVQLTAGTSKLLAAVAPEPAGGPLHLRVQGDLAALKVGDLVRVRPVRDQVSYLRDIAPILQVNCLPCHGGRGASGFSIATPERLRSGGPRGKGIVPGRSAESLLYLTMSGDRNPRMPPDRDATREQLDLLHRWIEAGAVDDSPPK